MTKYIVVETKFHKDTLSVNYEALPVDGDGEYVWNGHFVVSKHRVRKAIVDVTIYFLNEYKLAIDKAMVSISRKELIGNDSQKEEPPGIFVK